MGLLSDILSPVLGSGQKQKQTTSGTTAQETQQKQAQVSASEATQTGATTQQQQETRTGEVRLLDPEAEAALKQLFIQLTGQVGAAGGTALPADVLQGSADSLDFARLLRERAGGGEQTVADASGAIVSEARRQGENALEAQGTRLASATGSNINSIVQAINAQGRGDLESQLAALQADLAIRGRQLGSEELATAFGATSEATRTGADVALAGSQTGVSNVSQLAQALRGVVATSAETGTLAGAGTSEQTTKSYEEQLAELIQELTQQTKGKSTSKVDTSPGLLDIIGAFGS